MSIRRLMATAAGGMAIAIGAGQMSPLHAQNASADFKADNAFVTQVAAANLFEVRLGQLAHGKATTQAVKDFGLQMANQHTTMQQQWLNAARKNGAPFSARYTAEHSQHIGRLNGLSGIQLDQAYMDLMLQEHQKNLSLFQTQGRSARSADVRSLVESDIPVLQSHYNLASQIRNQVYGGATVATNQPQPTPTGQNSPWENVKPGGTPAPAPTQPGQQPTTPAPAPTATTPTTVQTVSAQEAALFRKDAKFVREIAADHLLELHLGQLASTRAQNPSVQQYGRKMVADHTRMQEQWVDMTHRNGMPVKPGYGKNHRAKLTKLQKKSGREFDKEYMTLMVWNHRDYLNYFNREGLGANSAAVRDMVRRDTPMLMEHFNLAKQLGAQVDADVSAQIRTTSSR